MHVPPEVLVETTDSQYDVPRVGDPEWCSHIAPSHEKVPLDSAWTACWPQLHAPVFQMPYDVVFEHKYIRFPLVSSHIFKIIQVILILAAYVGYHVPRCALDAGVTSGAWAGRIMGRHNMDTGVGA